MTTLARRRSVDVAIVGAGTAGLEACRAAIARGARVALIEHGPPGTACTRVACMPSKLLVAAAEVAHAARGAAPFGVRTSVEVDGRAVMERVRRERDRFTALSIAATDRIPAGDRIAGVARFAAPGQLDVDGQRVEARAVVLATGSSPSVPAMFEGVRDRLVVSDDVFSWTSLPESLAVFGAGPLGLELGQALHRLGVRVRIFGRHGALGALTDPAVISAARAALAAEVPLDLDAHVLEVRREGPGLAVRFEQPDAASRTETFSLALVATGRAPDLDGLALDRAGVSRGHDGVLRFDRETMQCGSTSVFVAGDASADLPVLHEAVDEGRIAGDNAARYPDVVRTPRRSRLQITFCDPQLAIVGPGFEALSSAGELVVGQVDFEGQGRSRIMGRNRGLGHLYVDTDSGRFLGAELAGPSAEHLAHLLAWAHQQGLTIDAMLAMPIYHPVVEEGIRTALRDASSKRRR